MDIQLLKKKSAGKNASFKCSQVLSFTAAKYATNVELPESSYKKCKNEPINTINKKANICQFKTNFLFIINHLILNFNIFVLI